MNRIEKENEMLLCYLTSYCAILRIFDILKEKEKAYVLKISDTEFKIN